MTPIRYDQVQPGMRLVIKEGKKDKTVTVTGIKTLPSTIVEVSLDNGDQYYGWPDRFMTLAPE